MRYFKNQEAHSTGTDGGSTHDDDATVNRKYAFPTQPTERELTKKIVHTYIIQAV